MIDINAAYPLFVTENLAVLKDFYLNVFGFTAVFFEPEFYLHLVHPGTGNQMGFMLSNHASQPEFLHTASNHNGVIITFEVNNAIEAFEFAKTNGLDIILDYTEETWGQNHFIIKDPEGFMVDIVEDVNEQ